MSLSISKLVDLAGKEERVKGKVNQSELPERSANITKSRYYQSVKNKPRNIGNVVQRGTPAGVKSAPYGMVEVPKVSEPNGAMDPNAIRSKTDPLNALPYRFHTYGSEDVLFGLPESTRSSHNNVGLLRKAQASYQNRQQILAPRLPTSTGESKQLTAQAPPPSYKDATGGINPYKMTDAGSELNETYN